MPDLALGNSASYDGNTNNAAGIASALGSTYATASSGALTLSRVMFDNTGSILNIERKGDTDLGPTGGQTISSNTEGPVEINGGGLFGTVVTINSGVYLYSDDTAQPALKLNVPATVNNSGTIIGRGGNGGTHGAALDGHSYNSANGQSGGPAIEIASGVSGVTIVNNSGGKIGGGGGGGARAASQTIFSPARGAGGGGGAGGGWGGAGTRDDNDGIYVADAQYNTGNGGDPGGQGQNGRQGPSAGVGGGGDAGGRGGWASDARSYWGGNGGGGGGGRVFPGTGFRSTGGQAGGLAGNAGTNGSGSYAGGGGGWGASGGGGSYTGGSGGKAIEDNGVTYTLTNNGTIYGGT